MSNSTIKIRVLLFIVLAMFFVACSPRASLRLNASPPPESGTYTLLSMGAEYTNDPRRAVVLDIEGDGFTFTHSSYENNPQTVKGLATGKALELAAGFLRMPCALSDSYSIRSINTQDGRTVGYEITPDAYSHFCNNGGFVSVTYYESGQRGAVVSLKGM